MPFRTDPIVQLAAGEVEKMHISSFVGVWQTDFSPPLGKSKWHAFVDEL